MADIICVRISRTKMIRTHLMRFDVHTFVKGQYAKVHTVCSSLTMFLRLCSLVYMHMYVHDLRHIWKVCRGHSVYTNAHDQPAGCRVALCASPYSSLLLLLCNHEGYYAIVEGRTLGDCAIAVTRKEGRGWCVRQYTEDVMHTQDNSYIGST